MTTTITSHDLTLSYADDAAVLASIDLAAPCGSCIIDALYREARSTLLRLGEDRGREARYTAGLTRAAAAGGLNASGRARSAQNGREHVDQLTLQYDRLLALKHGLAILGGLYDTRMSGADDAHETEDPGLSLTWNAGVRARNARRLVLEVTSTMEAS